MNQVFQSAFAEDLAHMIDLKVSLGFSEQTYLTRAKQFDTFCFQHFPEVSELTEAIAFTWLKAGYEQMSKIIHTRVSFLRTFGKYLKSVGKTAYLISEQFTTGRTVFVPYIFDDEELTALFIAIDSFKSKDDTFCPILLSAYFRLTYTCGLRPAEGRLLKRNEVDLNSGELRIVNSKYHKSRNIVMSGDMRMLARKYAVLRDMKFPNSVYFFPSPTGDAYSARWIQGKFRHCFAISKPDVPKDLLPAVRVYDLRHRFATAVLHQWLDEKKELSSRLPYLSAYMGHKELSSTEYYIHLLPERLVKSAGIDWAQINRVIPRAELWEK